MQITACNSPHRDVIDARPLKAQQCSPQPVHNADASQATMVEQRSMRWCAGVFAGGQDE